MSFPVDSARSSAHSRIVARQRGGVRDDRTVPDPAPRVVPREPPTVQIGSGAASERGVAPVGYLPIAEHGIVGDLHTRGWSERRQAFVQAEDSDVLDASLLLMPLVHFIAPTDPRWLSMLDAIGRELVTDSLVHRYDPAASPDGLDGDEGTFSMAASGTSNAWPAPAGSNRRSLRSRRCSPTRTTSASTQSRSAPAASWSETSPQAFTHLGLISAAIALDRALKTHRPKTG